MKHVSTEEAHQALQEKTKHIFLDVRTPEEFARAHIEGAINIPLDKLSHHVEQFIPNKIIPIYVYCMSGSRSMHGALLLERLGYQNVFDIDHGILAWRIKKYPLVS